MPGEKIFLTLLVPSILKSLTEIKNDTNLCGASKRFSEGQKAII